VVGGLVLSEQTLARLGEVDGWLTGGEEVKERLAYV